MISKSMMIGQLPIKLTLIRCSYFECSHVYRVMAMVFNVTFYNMSAISWRSALLMGETTNLPYVTGRIAKYINIMIICIWDNMFIPHSLLDNIYIVTCTVQRENALIINKMINNDVNSISIDHITGCWNNSPVSIYRYD
jgi:hypothetical protein